MPAGRFNENRERTGYDKRGGITEERCGRDAAPTMWRGHLAALETPATQYSRVTVQRTSCQESQCWAMLGALFHQRFFRGRSV